jgi:protein O-GlcNAc transferase
MKPDFSRREYIGFWQNAAMDCGRRGRAFHGHRASHRRRARMGLRSHLSGRQARQARRRPVQVSYLRYPGTTGASFIDYVIADKIVAPLEHQAFFAETIVHLPDCYQVNDTKRRIAERTPTRRQAGLPEDGFVFCCFNRNWKIMPEVFDVWMRLLRDIEGRVLWLFQDHHATVQNLRDEARCRGIDQARLVFASRLPNEEYLAQYRLADLFLDTHPCNAHTTASDALWAGLPVLTQLGGTFAGRVAASLLVAIGFSELITHTRDDYEALAVELARNPARLARLKQRLAENRSTAPLFDTPRFTRHLELAYEAMMERHRAGLPPDHIRIG